MRTGWLRRMGAAIPEHELLPLVLVVAVVVRAVLLPWWYGQDFVVWYRASVATLGGSNIYAHHPVYPGGPYAYFPVFLYLELPFEWLAQHTGTSFVILGKLPIIAADLAVAVLVAAELRDRGRSERVCAAGALAFSLNPLVLYNGAYYGRFDSLGCALLLLAVRRLRARSASGAWWYALAVAAKTFPVFALVPVLRQAGRAWARVVLALSAVLVLISLPYLGSVRAYVHDIVAYDATKQPQGLSWQRALLDAAGDRTATQLSYALLAVFALATVLLARLADLHKATLLVLVLFLVCSKVVLEQYLLWPLPWLIVFACCGGRAVRLASAALFAVLSLLGTLANESFHPWGRGPWPFVVALTLACLGYLAVALRPAPRVGAADLVQP
jgi:hypothetical protein